MLRVNKQMMDVVFRINLTLNLASQVSHTYGTVQHRMSYELNYYNSSCVGICIYSPYVGTCLNTEQQRKRLPPSSVEVRCTSGDNWHSQNIFPKILVLLYSCCIHT